MATSDSLGDRIKLNYEDRAKTQLLRRTPVIIRVDGKAFHTFTRGLQRPYDEDLIECMAHAAKATARQLQGFKMGFIQSDEASFLLTDYDDLTTDAWFDYKVQKMCSIAASTMTAYFNHLWGGYWDLRKEETGPPRLAMFDARCFNIPEAEISNYFLWRSLDWNRNSLQMMAQANFSQKELHGQNRQALHDLLYTVDLNWATDTTEQQRNGTWLSKTGDFVYSIQPDYNSINEFRIQQIERGRDNPVG